MNATKEHYAKNAEKRRIAEEQARRELATWDQRFDPKRYGGAPIPPKPTLENLIQDILCPF